MLTLSLRKPSLPTTRLITTKKERWSDGKDPAAFIKTGLDAAGMSQADFEAALKEPAVQETLENGKPLMMSPKSGVPAYVVNNGKYLIHTKSIKPSTRWQTLSVS